MKFLNVILCLQLFSINFTLGLINKTPYRLMPPLNSFDGFDNCFEEKEDSAAAYCVIYAEIQSKPENPVWQEIYNFSLDYRRHYRHDHLFFGVCVEHCSQLYAEKAIQKYRPNLQDKELTNLYESIYQDDENVIADRHNYRDLLNYCLNEEFQRGYNLSLETFIEYCERGGEGSNDNEIDFLNILFVAVVVFIGCSVVASSFFDLCLKRKVMRIDLRRQHYEIDYKKRSLIILTAFSICRNFHRIVKPRRTSLAKDLQFMDGVKACGMLLVVVSHIGLIFMTTNLKNPEFFEEMFSKPENALFEYGTAIMQIFFCMSAFLFYVHFNTRVKDIDENSKISKILWTYVKVNTYRYFRLAPSLLLILLFSATYLTKLSGGPFWRHLTASEETFCRIYWWKILFLINNNDLHRKSCLHHTWYIAADMQLFEFFVIITLITLKYPRIKKSIYVALAILACAIPAIVTYALRIGGSYRLNPESYRFLYFKNDREFYESYSPFYMNLAGYLSGILCAEMYLKTKGTGSSTLDINNFKYNLLGWSLIPVFFGLCFIGSLWLQNDLPQPSLVASITYAAFSRPIWALLFAIEIFGLSHRCGWIAFDFLNWPLLRVLGRISYQTYLWHTVVARFLISSYREPPVVSMPILIIFTIAGFVLMNLLAFLLALLFEYPITVIVGACLRKRKHEAVDAETTIRHTQEEIKTTRF